MASRALAESSWRKRRSMQILKLLIRYTFLIYLPRGFRQARVANALGANVRAWRYRSPSVPYRAGTSAKVLRRSHADVIVITICAVTLSRAPNFKVAAIWTLRYRTHYIAARPHSRRAAASRLPPFRVQTSVWSASPCFPESLHHL